MFDLGYSTGTFDLLHQGHYELLKKCKSLCKTLIIGLVTDELGIIQKRKPVMSYNHRKTALENCKFVDYVVPFSGTTKQTDYKKMKFDVLFISDEYYLKHEYSSFEVDYPYIPIYYFPRTELISTSDIYRDMIIDVIQNINLYNSGTGSDLLSYKYKNNKGLVVKILDVSRRELGNTKNNFNIDVVESPRNWKLIGHKEQNYPNLSGINPTRETEIYKYLKNKEWYPVDSILTKSRKGCNTVFGEKQFTEDLNFINKERKYSDTCYFIVQEDCGSTLKDVLLISDKRERYYLKVLDIIEEMRELGILHMDLHAENILVKNDKIYIIDFGWVVHKSFDMSSDERIVYENLLSTNFDLKHFRESLVVMGIETTVPLCLS